MKINKGNLLAYDEHEVFACCGLHNARSQQWCCRYCSWGCFFSSYPGSGQYSLNADTHHVYDRHYNMGVSEIYFLISTFDTAGPGRKSVLGFPIQTIPPFSIRPAGFLF